MELVPTDLIHGQVMSCIGLLVLTRIGTGTLVDLSLLCTHQEYVRVEWREIKAQSTGQSNKGSLIVIILTCQLQPDHLLWLDLILHQHPVHHTPVRRNRVEVELLRNIRVPGYLPDRVGMLLGPNSGLVNRPLMLIPDIID